MADDTQEPKKQGIGAFTFVGCTIIGLGIGLAFDLMSGALLIGLGVGFLGMAVVRCKTGRW